MSEDKIPFVMIATDNKVFWISVWNTGAIADSNAGESASLTPSLTLIQSHYPRRRMTHDNACRCYLRVITDPIQPYASWGDLQDQAVSGYSTDHTLTLVYVYQ